MADILERNKEVVMRHFEILNNQTYEALVEVHEQGGRNHATGAFDLSEWPADGVPFGPDEVRGTFEWLRGGFSDLRVEVKDLIAEGDKVAARIVMSGTHDGEFVGLQPTGRKWNYEHVHIFRVVDGKIAEHWAVRDDLRAMIQLGVVSPP